MSKPKTKRALPSVPADTVAAPAQSEIAIAEQLAGEHSQDWRFCVSRRCWLIWEGSRWSAQGAGSVVKDAVRLAVKAAAAELHSSLRDADADTRNRQARRLASAPTIIGVERILREMSDFAVREEQLDADPMLLNTPGGVVDLRSGALQPHRPELLQTKLTAFTPRGHAPRWQKFLNEAFSGDNDMIGYLKRMAGYFLTGSTQEHRFWMALGNGGNGKGIFFGTLQTVLGDYAGTATTETLMASSHDRHPTEIASLSGLRLVVASETESGARLAESRIKWLTGGDRVKARLMRQDCFEFTPQLKLVIVGNHAPSVRNVDPAMRRRLQILRFNHTPRVPDLALKEKLLAEGDGILAWMLEGLKQYHAQGLNPPMAVTAETEEYFCDEDLIGQWLTERYDVAPRHREVIGSANLHACWQHWCDVNDADPGSLKWLSAQLQARGLKKGQHAESRQKGFVGLRRRQGS